jgi:hypothetical protein
MPRLHPTTRTDSEISDGRASRGGGAPSPIWQKGNIMSVGTILIILLIIFLLGGFSGRFGGPGYGYGHRGNGLIGVLLIIVVVLLLTGRL